MKLVISLLLLSSTSPLVYVSAWAAKSPMFTNVEAAPLSGERFVGKRQGISHQITRQTASLLRGCEAVISEAEGGDPDKSWGLALWHSELFVLKEKSKVCFWGGIFIGPGHIILYSI